MFMTAVKRQRERLVGAVFAAILTIGLILAAVMFGGLLPQGLPPEAYLDRFGEAFGRIFLTLGLDDIYRTKGFLLLGLLLFVQLAVCTGKRLLLLRGGVKTWVIGSVLMHVGLLVFLISTGISLWWGRSVMVEVPEGKTLSLTQQGVPFDLQLERFSIDYYPDSHAVRQYRSDVVLTRAGQELRRGSLEVNNPLSHEGAKVFQMSYGWLIEGSMRQLPDGKAEPFSLANGGWLEQLGPDKDRLRAVLVADPDKHSPRAPEVAFVLVKESGARQTAVVTQGASVKDAKVEIRFDRLRRYSGLQVKQDPGVTGIFGGLTLALLGLMLRYVPLGGSKSK